MTHPSTPNSPAATTMAYALRLIKTQAATGYFMPVPQDEPDFAVTLAYLHDHPNDVFMHRYGLQQMLQMPLDQIRTLIDTAGSDRVLTALLLEAVSTHDPLASLQNRFTPAMISNYRHDTPLLVLRSENLPDQGLHRQWTALLKDNLLRHQPPPPRDEIPLAPLFEEKTLRAWVPLADVAPSLDASVSSPARPSFETVYATALQRLERLGILTEGELRHESSLSPVALLRRWRMQVDVHQDRHHYRFSGQQTSYGKGLSLERARASCAMEIVERCSSFARVVEGGLPEAAQNYCLRRARLSELQSAGHAALNPDAMGLEVPYEDQPLYWIEGSTAGPAGATSMLVPFQAVFLFSNLDEIDLFSGLGSTGLAAGGTMAQAQFHALLECIERDAEAVQPYDPKRCFRLATRDAAVSGLLADYRARGIDVIFQDCSTGLGVPCYKCFVYGPGPDELAKGTSAHFAGWQAALAALTETPYPYPHGPSSRSGPVDLPIRYLEALPDYSSDNMDVDLHRLETLLAANHFHPVYVDLTRRDLAIPVVRALVPGLELMADFDRYTRVNPRLYYNYLGLLEDSSPLLQR